MSGARHFLEVDDLDSEELAAVLDLAQRADPPPVLAGRGVALLFEKPSLRTRNATEMAVVQLGGHPLSLRAEEVGVDVREPAPDVARTLSRYHAAIGARVFEHAKLERMAAVSSVPVVNLLSDDAHPCEALADLLTLRRQFGRLEGLELAYVGDFNNVARSLGLAAALSNVSLRYACPDGYGPHDVDVARVEDRGGTMTATTDPAEAVTGAHAVYTDVWASMGAEDEAEHRRQAFEGFTVDQALMDRARPEAVFLHCLPAHRGEEVTADVVDGPRSRVWDQAENRMHTARGLLLFLLGPEAA
ncbi:MAG: ornithine carbamoyltransferase [Actinomycetota bacterium]|nr:ornithine carbamoyltransferase [Actinomycetota bacterium]MDQ3574827.1 ornithine carbamoyltransferase [Actinomycetota bacterium]